MKNENYLTVEEAAEYLQVSVNTIYYYTGTKKIKFTKPTGRQIYFNKIDLDEFLSRNVSEVELGKN